MIKKWLYNNMKILINLPNLIMKSNDYWIPSQKNVEQYYRISRQKLFLVINKFRVYNNTSSNYY